MIVLSFFQSKLPYWGTTCRSTPSMVGGKSPYSHCIPTVSSVQLLVLCPIQSGRITMIHRSKYTRCISRCSPQIPLITRKLLVGVIHSRQKLSPIYPHWPVASHFPSKLPLKSSPLKSSHLMNSNNRWLGNSK